MILLSFLGQSETICYQIVSFEKKILQQKLEAQKKSFWKIIFA